MKLPLILFALVLSPLSVGAHRTLLAWILRVFPGLRRAERPLRVLFTIAGFLPVVSRLLVRWRHGFVGDGVLAALTIEMMFVLVVALPLLVLRRLARHGAASAAAFAIPATSEAPAPTELPKAPAPATVGEAVGRRHAIEVIGGTVALGATAAVLRWGATSGRHELQVTEVPVRIPGLPRVLDGYSIVQISDIHSGLFVGERELGDGAARIRALRPDMVVVTGDMVDSDVRYAPILARTLADLAPRDGVFAILGNHDYYAGADAVSRVLSAAGVTRLVNDGVVVRPRDGGGFALLGADDLSAPRFGGEGVDLDLAAARVPRHLPRILLAHQPDTIRDAAGRVALQLSGHTHGGQIRPLNLLMRYVAGRYEVSGTTLYVNRGFGVALAPERLGVPPEITRVILVAA